jgi:heat shock protein HslJ
MKLPHSVRIFAICVAGAVVASCESLSVGPYPTQPPANLAGTSWRLVATRATDGAPATGTPDDPSKYTLTFGKDGRVAARLDCNRGAGTWRSGPGDGTSGSVGIGPLASTRASCPPSSQGEKLAADLGSVRSYLIADRRLNLSLLEDNGILVWEPLPPPVRR